MHRREAAPQLDGHDGQSEAAGRRAEEGLFDVLRPEADEGGSDGAAAAAAAALGLVFATAFVVGVVLNTLLLVVYCRRRGFRSQISNRFVRTHFRVEWECFGDQQQPTETNNVSGNSVSQLKSPLCRLQAISLNLCTNLGFT